MPGPPPKAANQRRRRNQTSTATQLVPLDAESLAELKPQLAQRDDGMEWHPAALAYWDAIWLSPMASEYAKSDVFGMVMLMDLVHLYWTLGFLEKGAIRTKQILAAEIRLQAQNYGLSPLDRRRLQWAIVQAEDGQDKRARRRSSATGKDPREQYPIQP